MRKISWIAAVAVVLGGLAGGPVAAHDYDGTTGGTWEYDGAKDRFRGRVDSFEKECERRRLVRIQKATGNGWKTVGKARSNHRGRWREAMTDAEGTFRVVVRARKKVTAEHEHVCRRNASRSVDITY